MWLQLDPQQLDILESALVYRITEIRSIARELKGTNAEGPKGRLLAKADANQAVLEAIREKRVIGENDDAYRAAAVERWHDEGSCEVDDEAVVSEGSDPGAYVMAWVWVTKGEAGVEDDDENVCRTCGESYADGGDGFDGECPSCADKTDQKLHPENYV